MSKLVFIEIVLVNMFVLCRDVFIMCWVDGMSCDDIVMVFDISVEVVKKYLIRVMVEFILWLEEVGWVDGIE